MTESSKIKPTHLARQALVYVRQSTATQLERNPESTDRQYRLAERALAFGWKREQIVVIDEDLGRSGSGLVDRSGFEKMASEVALGRVGIILGLEVSRLARNNSDWYRLLDLAAMTDTLIADADGLYHSGLFNDRLVLGLKGTMSEAELHVIRARLIGGIRNKAARGELRCGLPIGFVWGEDEGEIKFHPNEAVTGAIRNIFARFAEMGSARRVWLWFRSQGLSFPLQANGMSEMSWVTPTYWKIHEVLTNPVYAGVYAFGKTQSQRYIDTTGRIRNRVRHLPQTQWQVFIREHHEGFVDWQTYENNQARLATNTRPRPHEAGGAVREGAALLQGIATCGHCGRRLNVNYQGRNSSPGYHCPGRTIVEGRGLWCLRVGGCQIDDAVVKRFLEEMNPAGIEAALMAEASIEADHDAAVSQWRLEVERARYEAQRAERRYRTVEPENRLVARGLEAEWEKCLLAVSAAEAKLASAEEVRPRLLTVQDKEKLRALASDIGKVWTAPTTTDRDRKELLRAVLEEVTVTIARKSSSAHIALRWRGGAITDLDFELKRRNAPPIRTDEDTIDLVRRLAQHYPDPIIAGILNRQGRRTATGERFTSNRLFGLRRYWKIPKFESKTIDGKGKLLTIDKAAAALDVATSTVHRWLAEGFIAGEQITPGAPWQIRLTDEVRARFVENEVDGFVPMINATKLLGVTRQTIMQRIKRGELQAVHIIRGKRKGLRIKISQQDDFSERQLNVFKNI
jgi:DNA invertase Pin-like site-specific DNA recombinase